MFTGPNISTDGLVLALDAANTKSYPGSGTTWFDLSGNSNHFTLYNSPVFNQLGYFTLDGIDDYIRSTNTLDLSFLNTVTIVVWFKPNNYPSSGNLDFVYEHTANFNSSNGGFVHTYNDISLSQNYEIFLGNRGNGGYNIGVWSKSLFNDLLWKNSTAVIDRTQVSIENLLYVNGNLATAIANPYPGYTGNNTNNFANDYFYIGSRGGTIYYSDFLLRGIFIYNRALTATEILQNYNATKSRFNL